MGTRSIIAKEQADGTFKGSYCHWDGYPEHHMPILQKSYNTEGKVDELLDQGDISILDNNIGEKQDFDNREDGTCLFYHRDREEEKTEPIIAYSIEGLQRKSINIGAEYLYITAGNGKWNVTKL